MSVLDSKLVVTLLEVSERRGCSGLILTHWALKNPLCVEAGTDMRTPYLRIISRICSTRQKMCTEYTFFHWLTMIHGNFDWLNSDYRLPGPFVAPVTDFTI